MHLGENPVTQTISLFQIENFIATEATGVTVSGKETFLVSVSTSRPSYRCAQHLSQFTFLVKEVEESFSEGPGLVWAHIWHIFHISPPTLNCFSMFPYKILLKF